VKTLDEVMLEEPAITEFSVCAVGLRFTHAGGDDLFLQSMSDVLIETGITRIELDSEALRDAAAARRCFGFDFDDAHQYAAATRHNLTMVSLNADFDRTDRGCGPLRSALNLNLYSTLPCPCPPSKPQTVSRNS